MSQTTATRVLAVFATTLLAAVTAAAQLTDVTETPNTENVGIKQSLANQIGTGRGDEMTPDSSIFIIKRDPARSVSRGRQLFQRKFRTAHGLGPRSNDGIGNIETSADLGAGLADSCAACHGRPHGSAGFGGDVFTRPDSRDAPHLFGLGLVEMLADEMTSDLRQIRATALQNAANWNRNVNAQLWTKGVHFGHLVASPNGTVNTSGIQGVNTDLRVRPFFHDGREFSIRGFIVGAFNDEMGMEAYDPDFDVAAAGGSVTTPSGLVLDGTLDTLSPPPAAGTSHDSDFDGVVNEVDVSLIDHMEFYLLNYFKPGRYRQNASTFKGLLRFTQIGCAQCHVRNLPIQTDRRVADVETNYDGVNGGFNHLYSVASTLFTATNDGSGFPDLKLPTGNGFLVKDIFSDLKRHDLGPAFHERNFDGTMTTQFVTEPLWGVGSTPPYGHDGRSINLIEVILRHGGEAQASRNAFANLNRNKQNDLLDFLRSLVIFGPPDTASNLDPKDESNPSYPQRGHGSIDLTPLFNNPGIKE